jgi:Matrixin
MAPTNGARKTRYGARHALRIATAGYVLVFALGAVDASRAQAYTLQESKTGAPVRWHADRVTLRVEPAAEAYFDGMALRSLLNDAAAAWSGIDGVPELLISDGAPGPQAVDRENGVYLVKHWKLQENALAVTLSTFEIRTGKLVDADILINANYPFASISDRTESPAELYDLPGVMTHEIGHVLGLGESYDEPLATMWPAIAPGETRPRDLDGDDRAGAEEAYGSVLLSERVTSAGCGGASVVRRPTRSGHGTSVVCGGAALLLAVWACWRNRRRAPRARHVLALGGVLLFGAPLTEAPRAPAAPLAQHHTAAPIERLAREHPLAKRRLAAFFGQGARAVVGEAVSSGAFVRDGLIWTRFRVHGADADVDVEIPGGSLDGLTQIVSEQTLPSDGDTLVVAPRERGSHVWAHFRDGALFGGSLGEGPALEWHP